MLISDSFALRIGVSRHSAFMLFVVPILRALFAAVLALCGASAAYVLYMIMRRRIAAYRSPLRNVPGPENVHWFKGNFADVREPDSTRLQEEWVRTYGHVLKFHSTLGVRIFIFIFVPLLLTTSGVEIVQSFFLFYGFGLAQFMT
jgi:ABC-type amino acid transport system permease subunit